MPGSNGSFRVCSFGSRLVPYDWALKLQAALVATGAQNTILCMQHNHTITIGKRGRRKDVKSKDAELEELGVSVHHVLRGGEVTYHGPGQLVVYPVLNIRELNLRPRRYVDGIEHAMIQTVSAWGVDARGNVPGKTGVWVEDRKIGAVGVRFSQGRSTHGIALNVTTDLGWFQKIIPCGQPDALVTSVQQEFKNPVSIDVVEKKLIDHVLDQLLQLSHTIVSPCELQLELTDHLPMIPDP